MTTQIDFDQVKYPPDVHPTHESHVRIGRNDTEQAHYVTESPRWVSFQLKQARLREDQVSLLGSLTRNLQSRRAHKYERITENTLIRVAIDLLLANANRLEGNTETELLQSLLAEPELA